MLKTKRSTSHRTLADYFQLFSNTAFCHNEQVKSSTGKCCNVFSHASDFISEPSDHTPDDPSIEYELDPGDTTTPDWLATYQPVMSSTKAQPSRVSIQCDLWFQLHDHAKKSILELNKKAPS